MKLNQSLIFLTLMSCIIHLSTAETEEELEPQLPELIRQPPSGEMAILPGPEFSTNNSFVLECEANFHTTPKYWWTKNGREFSWQYYSERIFQQDGKGTLNFTSYQAEDAGQYQCFATNELGTATSNSVVLKTMYLNKFKDSEPLVVHAKEGAPYKLSCNPPDGYPKPEIVWMLQKLQTSQNNVRPIFDSPRITTGPDGNLWFSSVTMEDNSTYYAYICFVSSGPFRINGSVTYLSVIPKSGSSSVPEENTHVTQYVSKKNTSALIGSTLKLWCIFGGTAHPRIKWTRDEKPLSTEDIYEFKNYGKTLYIDKVMQSDEGNYECSVENNAGAPLSHSFHLLVGSAPSFANKTKATAPVNGQKVHKIVCETNGNPVPTVRWTRNGKRLRSDSKIQVIPNTLRIVNITEADSAIFGCNASNKFGYVYKDVNFSVVSAPAKLTFTQKYLFAQVGTTEMKLYCDFGGHPTPSHSWRKNGHLLISKDFYTTRHMSTNNKPWYVKSSSIYWPIQNFTPEDAGEYSCHVHNKFGSDNATITVLVQEPIQQSDIPKSNRQATLVPNVYFICLSNPQDPSLEPSIIWLINGKRVDYGPGAHYVQLPNNTLKVINVANYDSEIIYSCMRAASSRWYSFTNVSEFAHLPVKDVPKIPKIRFVHCKTKTASVGYLAEEEIGRPVLFNQIEYNTSFNPDVWQVVPEQLSVEKYYTSIDVSPWTNYTFRVRAHNDLGASLPSNLSRMCSTEPAAPDKNPDDVKGRGSTPSNMIISWKRMPRIEHNGPNFLYIVEWKLKDDNFSEWFSENITDWRTDRYVVNDLPNLKEYFIKVRAKNDIGESEAPANIVIGSSGFVAEPDENTAWIVLISLTFVIVVVLLAVALTAFQKYCKNIVVSQKEVDGFHLGKRSRHRKDIASSMPYDKKRYEVAKKSVKFEKDGLLGSGEFAMVCKGSLERSGSIIDVAIKTANPAKAHRTIISGLLSEIKVLAYLGKHENITELLGVNTSELRLGKVYILLELCPLGSLEKYLRKIRPVDDEQMDVQETDMTETKLLAKVPLDPSISQDLYRWSQEICNGMAFLATKHVVHADLATRNILLGVKKEAKICDFGLSRRMYNYASYIKSQQEPLPWKWMAPESLRVNEFNEKTDVWAFGITLWEMYSLGNTPYQGMSCDFNFGQMLQRGFRLGEPEFSERNMYSVMKKCWTFNADLRPTFADLAVDLTGQ